MFNIVKHSKGSGCGNLTMTLRTWSSYRRGIYIGACEGHNRRQEVMILPC